MQVCSPFSRCFLPILASELLLIWFPFWKDTNPFIFCSPTLVRSVFLQFKLLLSLPPQNPKMLRVVACLHVLWMFYWLQCPEWVSEAFKVTSYSHKKESSSKVGVSADPHSAVSTWEIPPDTSKPTISAPSSRKRSLVHQADLDFSHLQLPTLLHLNLIQRTYHFLPHNHLCGWLLNTRVHEGRCHVLFTAISLAHRIGLDKEYISVYIYVSNNDNNNNKNTI